MKIKILCPNCNEVIDKKIKTDKEIDIKYVNCDNCFEYIQISDLLDNEFWKQLKINWKTPEQKQKSIAVCLTPYNENAGNNSEYIGFKIKKNITLFYYRNILSFWDCYKESIIKKIKKDYNFDPINKNDEPEITDDYEYFYFYYHIECRPE